MRPNLPFLFVMLLASGMHGQILSEYDSLRKNFKDFVITTNTDIEGKLISAQGFNVFMQRKASYYLTGSSEMSISKVFATYSSEDDKLTFGFNIKDIDPDTKRLRSLFNPLLESNIKDGFSTVYKKGEWQSDTRLGFKYVLFFGKTLNFYGIEDAGDQQSEMIRKRSKKAIEIFDKINKETDAFKAKPDSILIQSKNGLQAIYRKDSVSTLRALEKYSEGTPSKKQRDEKSKLENDIREITAVLQATEQLTVKDSVELKKDIKDKLDEYKQEIAEMEADALYEDHLYTWSKTTWFSIWGFYPLTESEHYISIDRTTAFVNKAFNPWEGNLQLNTLIDTRNGALYFALGAKVFQNNSALAGLMTNADFQQYLPFPPGVVDTLNSAVIEKNDAFIGTYKEFVSGNINLQFVFSLSDKKKEGGDRFCTPGISIRFEQNIGDYAATNLRFGIPLKFRGEDKDKAVNIEPQIRLNDVGNYSGKVGYKIQPIIGINVGLPFAALFK